MRGAATRAGNAALAHGAPDAGPAPDPRSARPRRGATIAPRASYRTLAAWPPAAAECAIDLGDNTNLFGVPPAAAEALRRAGADLVTRYPTPFADALRAALARYAGVAPGEITTGCGSDDVLDSAIRAFASPGGRIAFPAPTFSMLPAFARMNGLTPVAVPAGPGGSFDPERLLAARARIVYLCSPNNPTGTPLPRATVSTVLERARGLVIVDEAYAEFAGETVAAAAPAHGRLLVVRTLSKAFGLAGLRVGYGIGAAALVAAVEKSRGPYKVSALSEAAAVAALTHDLEWVRERAAEAVAIRQRFARELSARGLAPLPSAANFVLVPVEDAAAVAGAMRARGVAVRAFARLPRIGDAVRITVGPWPRMEAARDALLAAVRCG